MVYTLVVAGLRTKMLLSAQMVSKTFKQDGLLGRSDSVKALDRVSFDLARGQSLGVVGESGSGKSTLLRTILKLTPHDSGTLTFDGMDIAEIRSADIRSYRRRVQPVFQDPYSTFNPRFSIGSSIALALEVNDIVPRSQAFGAASELLIDVGLSPNLANSLPHQLSGGQRQRASIARALAVGPELLLLDEPTSALDMSIQAQVLNLFKTLQEKHNFTIVFVTHDLALVSFMCDRIIVMKSGAIVEEGETKKVIADPQADYTRMLIAAVPEISDTTTP